MSAWLAWPLLAATLTAGGITWLLRSGWAGRLALDVPGERSLHAAAVPRSGGLVMLGAIAVCAWPVSNGTAWLPWLGLALVLGAVSWLDDREQLPIFLRFTVHLACAALAVGILLPETDWSARVPLVLLLVWCVNLYNFMDGADTLAGGAAVVGFGCYGAGFWIGGEPSAAVQSWVVAAAATGFLWFNAPPARIFLGDAGSIPLGFLAGVFGIRGWHDGVWPWWFPLLLFSPFLVDASLTLLGRMWHGNVFWQAHREHAYQRLIRMGFGHGRVALAYHGWMLAAGATGLALSNVPGVPAASGWQFAVATFGAAILVFAIVARCWTRSR